MLVLDKIRRSAASVTLQWDPRDRVHDQGEARSSYPLDCWSSTETERIVCHETTRGAPLRARLMGCAADRCSGDRPCEINIISIDPTPPMDAWVSEPTSSPPAASSAPAPPCPNDRGVTNFTSEDGRATAGVWACDTYLEHIPRYPADELCVVIEGSVIVTDESRYSPRLRAGMPSHSHGTSCTSAPIGPFQQTSSWRTTPKHHRPVPASGIPPASARTRIAKVAAPAVQGRTARHPGTLESGVRVQTRSHRPVELHEVVRGDGRTGGHW